MAPLTASTLIQGLSEPEQGRQVPMPMPLRTTPWLTAAAIYLLWFSAAFDPVGQFFGIRYVALLSTAAVLFLRYVVVARVQNVGRVLILTLLVLAALMPGYGLLLSVARGGINGPFIDTSYFAGAVYLGCALLYADAQLLRTALNAMVAVLRLLSMAILFCLVVALADLPNEWIYFFVTRGVTFYGEREYAGVSFNYIYFIASPMLVFLLAREAWRFGAAPEWRTALALSLPAVALFVTGTRANMAISILGVLFTLVWRSYGRNFALSSLLVLPLAAVLLKLSGLEIFQEMFSAGEDSNATKIGYLESYAELFSDPWTLIFGQGFNAHAWSQTFAAMLSDEASKTELTYIEILRLFGLPIGSLVLACLVYLSVNRFVTISAYPWVAPATAAYLLISSLNPYLFSANGMLLLGFAAAAANSNRTVGRTGNL